MDLKLIDDKGQETAKLPASDVLFGRDYNQDLVHQVVIAYQANARSGNRAQKTRAEVAKSTRKPWRQKGTGRARAGMASSPIWRGGGMTFPNSPDENFTHKVNKKMYRAGMCSILSELARQGRISVVDDLMVDTPKTKALAEKVKKMGFGDVLIVTDNLDENLYLSSRNLTNVMVIEPHHVDPVSLVRFSHVLMTRDAVKKFEEWLS
ncbi:MAG: 50S ribosomal protein L4 [Sulfuricellaceae bacterium]|nr:50S ribosomal protein L4 [Sulfuricellaceae bacterium]